MEFKIDIKKIFTSDVENKKSFCGVKFRTPTIKDIHTINTVRDYIYDSFQTFLLCVHHKQAHILKITNEVESANAIKEAFKLIKNADGYTTQEIHSIFLGVVDLCQQEYYNTSYVYLKNIIFKYCKENVSDCYGTDNQEDITFTKGQFKDIESLELGTIEEHEAFEKELIVGFLDLCVFKPLIKRIIDAQNRSVMALQKNG